MRFATLILVGVGSILAAVTASAQYTFAWQRFFDGTTHTEDNVQSLAVDSLGNSYVVGSVEWMTQNPDVQVLKYDPAGNLVWSRRINGEANGQDLGFGIALGGDGTVNVVCRTATNLTGSDILTVKMRMSDGLTVWARTYDGPAHSIDDGMGVEADAQGNVFVVGEVWNDVEFYPNGDYVTMKYDTAGNLVWARLFDGPATWVAVSDQPVALALDQGGNVVVTGNSPNASNADDWTTLKYRGSDGLLLWESHYTSSISGVPTCLQIGSDGDVFVGGSQNAMIIARYDGTTGVQEWIKEDGFPHAGRLRNRWAMTLDTANNPVVAVTYDGDIDDSNLNNNVQTTKYNGVDGSRMWTRQYGGLANLDGQYAGQVLCEPNGDVLMIGTERIGPAPYKFLLLKYASTTGFLLWEGTYTQPFAGANPRRSAFDAAGNLLVAAITNSAASNPDISVLKFTGAGPSDLAPSGVTLVHGVPRGGNTVSSLVASDDARYRVRMNFETSRLSPKVVVDTVTNVPSPTVSRFDIHLEARSLGAPVTQAIHIWNGSAWIQVDSAVAATADTSRTVSVTTGAGSYLIGGQIKVRITYFTLDRENLNLAEGQIDMLRLTTYP